MTRPSFTADLQRFHRAAARLASLPALQVLQDLARARQIQVYLVGGTVRELVLGGRTPDLDLAVSHQTLELAQELAQALQGTYVLLDEAERTARVVAFPELGMEAVYEFEVRDMPVTVAVDSRGNSVHNSGPRDWRMRIGKIPVLTG